MVSIIRGITVEGHRSLCLEGWDRDEVNTAARDRMAGAPVAEPATGVTGCFIHFCLGVWGLCSWVLFNGLWAQLPLFIRTLPEGNRMGVLMIAAMQLAYLFPLAFMFKKSSKGERRSSMEIDIWVLLVSGLVISLLLSSFWNVVADVGGVPHSVGLLTLTFLAGAVCSSTGVVFTPYLANHPQSRSFTSAFAAGGGLSGLLVAFLALIADPGAEKPRLRIETYFYTLSVVFVCSIVAFLYVRRVIDSGSQYRPLSATEPSAAEPPMRSTVSPARPATAVVVPSSEAGPAVMPTTTQQRKPPALSDDLEAAHVQRPSGGGSGNYGSITTPTSSGHSGSSPRWPLPPAAMWPVLLIQCLLSSLAYGVVPSVLPLAVTRYGSLEPSRVLEWAILGYMIADPVGKIAVSFLCTHMVYLSATIALTFAGILLACAALSPHPPLHAYDHGALLPVCANILFSFMLSFTSTSIFLQKVPNGKLEAYKWFRWSAFMNQTGAFIGAGGTLILVYLRT